LVGQLGCPSATGIVAVYGQRENIETTIQGDCQTHCTASSTVANKSPLPRFNASLADGRAGVSTTTGHIPACEAHPCRAIYRRLAIVLLCSELRDADRRDRSRHAASTVRDDDGYNDNGDWRPGLYCSSGGNQMSKATS